MAAKQGPNCQPGKIQGEKHTGVEHAYCQTPDLPKCSRWFKNKSAQAAGADSPPIDEAPPISETSHTLV